MGSLNSDESKIYPVIIVGAGPCGLAASIQLSKCNIPHVLFERYPSTARAPKAILIHSRTIEIFRRLGIEDELTKVRAAPEITGRTGWYTSFGPHGREIISRDAWGGGQHEEEYAAVSPCRNSWLPQIRLEPILRKRATELNQNGIVYGTEVVKVVEHDDHVLVTIQRRDSGAQQKIKAAYCIGADGGRTVTNQLGIELEGHPDVIDMVSVHIRAPLAQQHPDTRNFITWFVNPMLGGTIGSGYLYHLGPYPLQEKQEWLFACGIAPHEKGFDEKAMLKRLHATLQVPDLDAEVLTLTYWHVDALVAKRYRSKPSSGRVFLIGDAAHRVPPWGALGLNTGIQDLDNLLWKLSFAIKGLPPSLGNKDLSALLDTYDTERRPIAQKVRDLALHNLGALGLVMDNSIGISMTNSQEENVKNMESYFDQSPSNDDGADRREAVKRAAAVLDDEFHALGMEHGWFYPEVDAENEGERTNHNGAIKEDREFDILKYHPSTIPGHHLPHAWIEKDGKRISTRDLIRYDGFLLITARPGLWQSSVCEGGHSLVSLVAIADTATHEFSTGGYWQDVEGRWAFERGVAEDGAVLVRPDGIVAWRAKTFDQSKHGVHTWLEEVLRQVLKMS